MNTDIRVLNAALYLHDRTGRFGECQLRVNGVHVWRRGEHEREGHDVLCRIAAVEMRSSVIQMARCGVVRVDGQPVPVFRMVVIVEVVRVQRRRHTRRRHQRRDEQYRQGTEHRVSL